MQNKQLNFNWIKILGLFIIVCILISTVLFALLPTGKDIQPLARQGVLNCRDWDFRKQGVLKLNGEWEFYWKQLLLPADFQSGKAIAPDGYLNAPATWKQYTPVGSQSAAGAPINDDGFATFRLVIECREPLSSLALQTQYMGSAYRIFINGKAAAGNGRVGMTARTTVPQFLPQIITVRTDRQDIELILQVANFHYKWGGLNMILLGDETSLRAAFFRNTMLSGIALGILLVMCFYHLCLYLQLKKDKASLFYSLICLVIAVRTLSTDHGLSLLFQNYDIWRLIIHIDFLTVYLGVPIFGLFLQALFPDEIKKEVIRILEIISLFFIVLSCAVSTKVLTTFLDIPFLIITALASIYYFYGIFLAVCNHRFGAFTALGGFFILFVFIIYDILNSSLIIINPNLVPFGFAVFAVIKSLILSRKFSNAYRKLDDLTQTLEQKVKTRTRELEQSKEQIEQLASEKNRFFINFAHETKTPLTLIRNSLDRYVENYGLNDDLKILKQNIGKLERDMVNFLDIEKLNRGQPFFNHDQFTDFSQLLKTKILLFKEIACRKQIMITSRVEDDVLTGIDPCAADRIINNIMDNAIRYTNHGGSINVCLRSEGAMVEFSVSDTGIGISPEKQQCIFDPYYQISHTNGNTQGIGMGLYIVRKIMDDIRGNISLESAENKGTKFILSFRKPENKETIRITGERNYSIPFDNFDAPELREEKYQKGKDTLYIVEDNLTMIAYLQHHLQEAYNIFYATDGEMALKKIIAIPRPQLIISDIMMDRMDGCVFLEKIKEDNRFTGIPFIFLTARTLSGERIKGLLKGAVDFIYKPFSIEELKAKIDSLIKVQKAGWAVNINEIESKIHSILHPQEEPERHDYALFESVCNEYNITRREKEIIHLLIQGYEYKEIGGMLNISLKTIKPYIRKIYEKFKIHNKVELVNLVKYHK